MVHIRYAAGLCGSFLRFWADPEFFRSPSPTYSLPPPVAAFAAVLANQVSPEDTLHGKGRSYRRSIFVDDEASESETESNAADLLTPESSGESTISY